MILSKWSITPQGNFTRKGLILSSLPTRIVYLDDHKLFRGAVVKSCIEPFFQNINIIEFENGDDACEFIKKEIGHHSKIDLFITDINHLGLRGHHLAKVIRDYEKLYGIAPRIPIMMLTMVNEASYPELVADNLVDSYLTKATELEDIIDCIEEILYI